MLKINYYQKCNIKITDQGKEEEYLGVNIIAIAPEMVSFKDDDIEYLIVSKTMKVNVMSSGRILDR